MDLIDTSPAVVKYGAQRREPRVKILAISFSDLRTDPRVIRHIRLLTRSFRVTAAGFNACAVPGVEFCPIEIMPRTFWSKVHGAMLLNARRFEAYYWSLPYVRSAWGALKDEPFDAIVANDLNTLPLALRLSNGNPVLFDAHEYSPREFEEHWLWRFLFARYCDYLCRTYLRQVRAMITVSPGIAEEYRRVFQVDSDVVTNAAPYCALRPFPVSANRINLVHHGAALPRRKLESLIELMDLLDERFVLDLFLVPVSVQYFEHIRRLAARNPRIRLLNPMPMNEIPARTNRYDIGISFLPGTNFNNRYALPNKFFEFIQARLAVAVGPSPEMAAIVRRYDCGVVAGSFSIQSLAVELNALTHEAISHYKNQSDIAARELCFENASAKLLQKVRELAGTD